MTDPEKSDDEGSSRSRFRTFTGDETWDSRAIADAYAELQKRRAAAEAETRTAADLRQPTPAPPEYSSRDSMPMPTLPVPTSPVPTPGRAPTPPPVPLPHDSRSGSRQGDQPPTLGQVLYAVGTVAATAAVLAGCIWLLVDIFGGPSTAPAALATQSMTPTAPDGAESASGPNIQSDPAQVVYLYFHAIDSQNWQTAWQLGGDNLGQNYAAFIEGFSDTSQDIVTAEDTSPTTAAIQLTSVQDDGTQQQYTGTYIVINGVITAADVSAVG